MPSLFTTDCTDLSLDNGIFMPDLDTKSTLPVIILDRAISGIGKDKKDFVSSHQRGRARARLLAKWAREAVE